MTSGSERRYAALTYLAVSAFAHLAWESAQTPFYTVWTTGSRAEIAYDVLHCTAGDVIIAAAALAIALTAGFGGSWPRRDWLSVVSIALVVGVAYTAFSEWYNVYVRQSWAYATSMPVVHVGSIDLGLTPLLQWVVVPSAAFAAVWLLARRRRMAARQPPPGHTW